MSVNKRLFPDSYSEQNFIDYTQILPSEMICTILKHLPLSDTSNAFLTRKSWQWLQEDVVNHYAQMLGFQGQNSESKAYIQEVFAEVKQLCNAKIIPDNLIVYKDEAKSAICLEKTLLNLKNLKRDDILSIITNNMFSKLINYLLLLSRDRMLQHIETNLKESEILAQSAARGNLAATELLLNLGINPNSIEYPSTYSALMLALYHSHFETAKLIINRGANIHYVDSFQHLTALHLSASKNAEITKYLIEQGVDIEGKYSFERPLWAAVRGEQIKSIELLLSKGASTQANHYAKTLIALSNNKDIIIKLIDSYEEKKK